MWNALAYKSTCEMDDMGVGDAILYWVMNLMHFIIFVFCLAEVIRALREKDSDSLLHSPDSLQYEISFT